MSSLNKIQLIGNLGADAEARTTGQGKVVVNLRVATTKRFKRGDDWVDETEWWRVVVFGDGATAFSAKLRKGACVYIEGEGQARKWQDKDGVERTSFEVVARTVLGVGPRPRDEGTSSVEDTYPADGIPF